MNALERTIFIGNAMQQPSDMKVEGEYVSLLNDTFYRIHNYDAMPPFFMTLISSSNHWLFIASTGGLSAGRVDTEHALFPYYTVDKITENSENTGNKTILLVTRDSQTFLWEPLSDYQRNIYRIERNLYKNISGTAIIFEEINHYLGLTWRYAWRTSNQYGFVKTSWLISHANTPYHVEVTDGVQNLLPANVSSGTQLHLSSLLDAYKRSELEPETGLGLFALSSTLTDLAEPSESLKANTVWQIGLDGSQYLLSSTQLDNIRRGERATTETDIRGRRGAYFINNSFAINPGDEKSWHLVAEVDQDSNAVAQLLQELGGDRAALCERLEQSIIQSDKELETIIASADGLQLSNDHLGTAHHFANVLFNVMRGGVFANHYWIEKAALLEYIAQHHPNLITAHANFFTSLPDAIQVDDLRERAASVDSTDLLRLCYGYLPLTFSRRHGDPSRPWNRFSINVRRADGSQQFDFQGNWRDIFQNWEALAYSYPEFIEGMISTFLNAVTVDGYNPYRVTMGGIDWEVPEPDNPWANIGYWSDHQIVYLLKLMEVCANVHPGKLDRLLNQAIFSSANVPYRLKAYESIVNDPYNTIEFDWQVEREIKARVREIGSDGKLVHDAAGNVFHINLAEKLLILLLAKLSNFVPEGGIWMVTQRPEWNDANNALVGKGLSVVTVCHLRRYIAFMKGLLAGSDSGELSITKEVHSLFDGISGILSQHHAEIGSSFDEQQRRTVMDALGQVGSDYRWNYYQNGISGAFVPVSIEQITAFLDMAQDYVEHTLRANKRADNLYHTYNVLHLSENRATIGYLYEMLEGQVSILASGMLTAEESLTLLQTMRHSALYRADQHSYLLYPNRNLAGFLAKNRINEAQVRDLGLVQALVNQKDTSLITRDINGVYHFGGHLRNAKEVTHALANLKKQAHLAELVEAESSAILALFEKIFNHNAFTGRSGTFFAYEGLGSIYWHMVSKLLLAAQETALRAIKQGAAQEIVDQLIDAYYDIRLGLGFNKPPEVYGAFPTDPYSHTPEGQGAKQPGMTGMVKEEILTRMAELGLLVEHGTLLFDPGLVRKQELLTQPATFNYIDIDGKAQQIALEAGSLAFTFCQIPVVLTESEKQQIVLDFADHLQTINGNVVDEALSKHIFQRDGVIRQINVFCGGLRN